MRIGVLASVGHMLDSFFSEIVASWSQAGHEVSLAAGTPTRSGAATVIAGLTRRPGAGSVRAWSGLRDWVRREQLDVVITNTATASALARTARLDVPVVYFCHGLHWNEGRSLGDRLWQAAEHTLLRRTAGVITINSDDESWFSHRMPGQRILRLPGGVGLNPAAYPRTPVPATGPASVDKVVKLAWIGEFSARKRPHLVLEVAEALQADGVDASITMLGQGDLHDAFHEDLRRRGLQGLVRAPGLGDAAQTLAGSHALLHTATWEGLPRVMLEALAVGRRTYAFDVKGVRDIPGVTLAGDGDPAALAGLIAADWASGRILEPLAPDRASLDVVRTADAILLFLETSIVHPAPGRSESLHVPSAGHEAS